MSLLTHTSGFRHGIVLPPQLVRRGASDLPSVFNLAVPSVSLDPWKSAAGGIGRTREAAESAALGEALERYAAAICELPDTRGEELSGRTVLTLGEFSAFEGLVEDDSAATYTNAFSLADNAEVWVPRELVGLRESVLATSSGLAAGGSRLEALLRAVQELVERDALAMTWLHGVGGRRVSLGEEYLEPVRRLGGDVMCFDATPSFSPHAVALVTGQIPLRGRPRHTLGAACRETWSDAVEKAYLEWLQGVAFVGTYCALNPDGLPKRVDEVRSFDHHAVFYAANPDLWERIPLLRGKTVEAPRERPPVSTEAALSDLAAALRAAGVRMLYRELTTRDLREAGLAVVRALSPDLVPIWSDHLRRPLAGIARDVLERFPWAARQQLSFPNPLPHPLG